MAAQRQIPGGAYVNEVATKERQIPGSAYINEKVSTQLVTLSNPTVTNITTTTATPRVTVTFN